MDKLEIGCTLSTIEMVRNCVEEECKKIKLSPKEIMYRGLLIEEIMAYYCSRFEGHDKTIEVKKIHRFDGRYVKISIEGEACNPLQKQNGANVSEGDWDQLESIRNIIILSQKDKITYQYKKGCNCIYVALNKSTNVMVKQVAVSIIFAIICGILLKSFTPFKVHNFLNDCIFISVQTMFLNALKLIVAPVVFFSIVNCMSGLTDVGEFGKMGMKVMGMYLLTTFLGVGVGFLAFFLFKPGNQLDVSNLIFNTSAAVENATTTTVSLKDMIVNIVPSNLVSPIADGNMMQVIFVAVLCGIAVGMIGSQGKLLTDIFEACNQLFLRITMIIVKAIPIATFCSMTSLVISLGHNTFVSLLYYVLTFFIGIVMMIIVYVLLIVLIGRENPLPFLKKVIPFIPTPFSLSSSSATMPMTLQLCTDGLGIDTKLASFSIPIGATINMDGGCISMVITSLFFAQIYHIEVTPSFIITLLISTIILSIGAPGVPGSALICQSLLVLQLGIPIESMGLIVGIDQLCDMLRTANNVVGDVAASLVVAKTEHMVNPDIYKK